MSGFMSKWLAPPETPNTDSDASAKTAKSPDRIDVGESEVAWRVEAMKAQIVDGVLPRILRVAEFPECPGMCWSCGEAMLPFDETGKCVPCCLAAARIVLADMRGDIA